MAPGAALALHLALALSLSGLGAASRHCPELPLDGCLCTAERGQGPGRPELRIRVACAGGDLVATPQPDLLPRRTVSLILTNNKILGVKSGAFLGLPSLERLDLKNNLISVVEPRAFLGLPLLRRLDLSNNRIGCLTPQVFAGLNGLHKLNLSGNIFSGLMYGLFSELLALKVLHFGTDSLICDCHLRWVSEWAKNASVRLAEETMCAYPDALRGWPLRSLREDQLTCAGPLELPLFQLIPSQSQVVFHGDRLPFQCTATLVDNTTQAHWYHNGRLIETDEARGMFVKESVIHDCSLITRELTLASIGTDATGSWECRVSNMYGNKTKGVEITVLETTAPYCPAERIGTKKGDFRWPRTLAGMMASLPCLPFSLSLVSLRSGPEEPRAWRRCRPAGHWDEANLSECPPPQEVMQVILAFATMYINATNVREFSLQLAAYTGGASSFTGKMDIIHLAQMMEKLLAFLDEVKEVGDAVVQIGSNLMLVDDHVLWAAQNEDKACTRILRCIEHVADQALSGGARALSKVSPNIALEALVIQPLSFRGVSCIVFQKAPGEVSLHPEETLSLKCDNSGALWDGWANLPAKNAASADGVTVVASVHLPRPVPFAGAPARQSVDNSTCKLKLIVFRNGKLFPSSSSSGHWSSLAAVGMWRSVATPAVFAQIDGCSLSNLSAPVIVGLRPWAPGLAPVAAAWDFDLLAGHGGWRGDRCHLVGSAGDLLTLQCPHWGHFAVLMDLKTVLSLPEAPGEFLHPVVYACTAVMLLCLFTSILTYIVHHSTIRISRKGWHMLLNFSFHTALTFAVFAGGINRTQYPIVCQAVGITLHYSTLSTMLWIGVTARNIYKQVTKKVPQGPGGEQPPYPKQPLLRFYLISGGVPLIICGITAATNIKNYGPDSDGAPYCWMAWEPSLGAFYGPVAFIALVTCVYFLCTYVQLRRHPERKYELKERREEQQRLAVPEASHGHLGDPGVGPPAACSVISASLLENEHSFKAQLRAAAFTLFLFLATWTFGALAVSQGPFLDMIFSCLYGAFCVTLGLFILIHHCAKRDDVWHCWWSCCPSRRNAYARQVHARAQVNANGDAHIHTPCLQDSPCLSKAGGFAHAPGGHCKLTNLHAAQNHVNCLSPVTPCCAKMHCEQLMEDEAHIHVHREDAFRPNTHLHRCLKNRVKPRYFSRHRAAAAEREYAYHIPSSLDGGSIHSSHTDSPHSTHEGQPGHHRSCCGQGDPFPTINQPESSDASTVICSCTQMSEGEVVPHAAHFEMHPRTQALPCNTANHNGLPTGNLEEAMVYGPDSTGNIKTGPWRNETTV
ncbi:adhesion G protein-coupled receptor A1 [Trichosurus vulpecula]|uniref:adhesion G protein-coupled receptor A1 n=1 Tax=Trichosurus vulpecula TaxID=9337 RepID=UPI00186AD393|nr:adhesion G protein-coupled receptor A1 [Trichosurus vulpecula]